MRLALNLEQLLHHPPGGIGSYTAELARLLPVDDGDGEHIDVVSFVARHSEREIDQAMLEFGLSGTEPVRLALPRPVLYDTWNVLGIPSLGALSSSLRDVDLVHAPSLAVPPRGTVPLIVTVHDAAPLAYPDTYPWRGRWFHKRGFEAASRRSEPLSRHRDSRTVSSSRDRAAGAAPSARSKKRRARWATASSSSDRSERIAWSRCTTARTSSRSRAFTKASVSPCSRRCRSRRPSSAPTSRFCGRWPVTRRASCRRATRTRGAPPSSSSSATTRVAPSSVNVDRREPPRSPGSNASIARVPSTGRCSAAGGRFDA